MAFRGFRALALGVAVLFSLNASGTQAAVITQTINFDFTGFLNGNALSAPNDPVTGQVVVTYDNASPVSIVGQAVDSISFSTPVGVFDTSNVFFDLRIAPDLQFTAQDPNRYEFDIYHDTLPVFFGQADDFLFRISAFGNRGDEWNPGGITSASGQFLYVDAVGNELFTASNNVSGGGLTSTTQSAPTTIAAPASLAFLGFGMLAIGLKRRRARF